MGDFQRMSASERPTLSICIATYNRGHFIAETLDSIVHQLRPEVEVIVVDGASSDGTPELLERYTKRHAAIRYYREIANSGVDRDYDKSVQYANGEYCWLMTDDDLLRPGAIQRVLQAITMQPDLIIVNADVWNADFTVQLEPRRLPLTSDQSYSIQNRDEFFVSTMKYLSFIGCVVINREKWISRDRQSYFGSLFVHVGVIFQHPPLETIHVLADPQISIRYGNAMWTLRSFEIWSFKWPALVWSFPDYTEQAKRIICGRSPWRRLDYLFYRRATSAYTLETYNTFLSTQGSIYIRFVAKTIALFPSTLANFIVVMFVAMFKRKRTLHMYDLLHNKSTSKLSLFIAQLRGIHY